MTYNAYMGDRSNCSRLPKVTNKMSEIFVGVDGCKGVDSCKTSWFAIALKDNGDPEANCFRNISELWDRYKKASMILVDIPIGLLDKGNEERKCDKEARAKLKSPRASSVFPAPCRRAIREEDYNKAKEINKDKTEKGLTKQTFAIMSKIRDVDNFLLNNKAARSRIKETHPEICFWALSGHPMVHSKKKSEGQNERIKVLESVYSRANDIFTCAKSTYRRKEVAIDDILDALAAAVTAMLGYQNGFETLPQEPERDSQGLPMQMLYYLHET
jgi:predicted RNase H-like nuclease